VKRLHFSFSPTTVLYTTMCCCLKLSIHPLEALKSSMSNTVAICSRFSLSAVPLIPTDFKHTANKTFQLLKWWYSQAVLLTTEHARLCVTLTGIFSVFNNSV
jgi:predicted secreted hydrolase